MLRKVGSCSAIGSLFSHYLIAGGGDCLFLLLVSCSKTEPLLGLPYCGREVAVRNMVINEGLFHKEYI